VGGGRLDVLDEDLRHGAAPLPRVRRDVESST
jgi:hypothetical protein